MIMTKTMFDLDDIATKIHLGVNAINAIHEAMTEGASSAESFTDGLLAMTFFLDEQDEKLRAAVEDLFKEQREAKKK